MADDTISTTISTPPTNTSSTSNGEPPKIRKKKKLQTHKSKMVTGYIIYASEIRKEIIKQNPERNFGDISKIVGVEWKKLPQEAKIAYEKRAQEQNVRSKIDQPLHIIQQHSRQSVTTNVKYYRRIVSSEDANSTDTNNNDNSISLPNQTVQPILQSPNSAANDTLNSNNSTTNIISSTPSKSTPSQNNQINYQRNNIVYRKPATVRLKPRDSAVQTEPIKWVTKRKIEATPRFSQKFLYYLDNNKLLI